MFLRILGARRGLKFHFPYISLGSADRCRPYLAVATRCRSVDESFDISVSK